MLLEIKQLTRLQIIRYCDKLEQENKKLKKENFVMKDRLKFWYKWVTREEIERVEEENKSLKAEIKRLKKPHFSDRYLKKLEEENKKLKVIIENNDLEQKADWKHIEELEEENGTLKDKIEFLTQCLDDRDKSIELMKGTVAQYMIDGETELQLNGNIGTLLEENKKLKEDFDNYKNKVSEDMKEIVKDQTENIKLFDRIKGEYKKLEEENRELKKENELLKECNIRNYTGRRNTDDMNLKLLEENKKLKKRIKELEKICEWYEIENNIETMWNPMDPKILE